MDAKGASRIGRAAALVCAAALAQSPAHAQAVLLPEDEKAVVGGFEVACTGVGQTRQDRYWTSYPVRVEFSNAANEYLAGAQVILSDRSGRELLNVACNAPWVLMRLPPGEYRVEARLTDVPAAPRSARFRPPAEGQMRLVLQFPDA